MRRWVRALPMLLVGALAAITTATATTPAPAEAGAATAARATVSDPSSHSGPDLQLTPIGSTGGGSGAGIALEVDPGASVKRSFVVTNRSTALRVTVHLAGVDATVRSSGNVTYARNASTDGPGGWLTLSDVVTTLEPGAKVRVALTVTPPANATPGDMTAGIVARVDQAARASDNSSVNETAVVTLPVTIKIKGAPTALVSIASVTAVKADGHDYLGITFQNSGATANSMTGQVRVSGPHPRATPVHATIAPLTHTNVRVPFTMPNDAKAVPVSVSTTDARGDEATWSGDVGSSSRSAAPASEAPRAHSTPRHASSTGASHGASLPPLALALVALGFLAAAVWFGLEIRRNRAGRRAVRAARPAPIAMSAAGPAPGDAAHMGAVATQLAALVDAIDRLVGRLGEVTVPVAGTPVASPSPSPSPSSEPVEGPVPRNPAPMFFAPAANRGPPDEFDPYDWPTEEQLDQFAARRRAAQSDM